MHSLVWHQVLMFLLKIKTSLVFFTSTGNEFHNLAPKYLKDLNPYFMVWNFGWTSLSLSLKLYWDCCKVNRLFRYGGFNFRTHLKTSMARCLILIWDSERNPPRFKSSLYVEVLSRKTKRKARSCSFSNLEEFLFPQKSKLLDNN